MADEKLCPQCGRSYSTADRFCTVDGATLVNSGNSGSLIGTVLAERYLVSERLGEGGMGEVYLAEHVRMKRKVAVKIMRKWMAGDPVAVSRFHREAENASQITHPNVAQVYDFGETSDGTIYLAMEFVPGEPLSRTLEREGRLNAVRSQEIVRQTADALVAAHGMGILHRDLKPDNVMVARSRVGTDIIKLVDFGIARVMTRGTQQFTSTGMIVGTPEYMSPEQLANDNLDERSDLYALGLIAFRTLTGHGAFPEGTSGDALIARLTNRARKLKDVLPDVDWPDSLQAAFDKVLAADPAARFADALEFAAELDGAVSTMPLSDDEQAYLLALTQRAATPIRLGTIDTATPVRAMNASSVNTPPVPRRSIALRTPPSEQFPASSQSTAPFTPPKVPTSFGIGDTGELEPPVITPPNDPPNEPPDEQPRDRSEAMKPTVQRPAVRIELAPDLPPMASDSAEISAESFVATARNESAPAQALEFAAKPKGGSARTMAMVGGALGVIAIAFLVAKMRGGNTPDTAPIAASSSALVAPAMKIAADSLPKAAVVATDSSRDTTSAAVGTTPAADSQRVARARGAVLVAQSSAGSSTALIVDSKGLLLTAATVVPADHHVDVFVDGDRKVKATVVKVDEASGVAVLLASLAECKRCRAMDVVALDSGVSVPHAGDTLVALSASRRSVQSLARAVQGVGSNGGPIATTASIPAANFGAPVIAPHTGAVVGLVAKRGNATAVISATSLAATLRSSRGLAASLAPNDSLFWSWPTRPVPQEALDAGLKLAESAVVPYKVTSGGYTVFAVTPPILAWRYAKSGAAASDALNPFDIPGATTPKTPDPAAAWRQWGRYHAERRAVVILDISPEKASYPATPGKLLEARDADFVSMEIKRDGVTLIPIESQRVSAVVNQEEYRRKKKPVPNAGIYVFHPLDFASTSAKYVVDITDASGRHVSMSLPTTFLAAIADDLGGWQKK
ncbi:MAG: protein kinase [Gemmatimonadaceae bacterium]